MHKIKNFIILIVIFIYAQSIQSRVEDLIELNCVNATECKQFEQSGIKSSCLQDQCRCTSSDGKSVRCQPVNSKLSNFIGGLCPCSPPNTVCDEDQNICYCSGDLVSSSDKRRCIPKTAALNEQCEETVQCQRVDVNAVCHKTKMCKCMSQFVNDKGVCVSALGNISASLNDSQCQEKFGANSNYSQENEQCICTRGYFASIDNSKCLKVAKYLENCSETLQCMGTMGLGGTCIANACNCEENYFVEEEKNDEGGVNNVCTPVVKRGQYCRRNEDCYQRQLSEEEQSMHCTFGECNCRDGFNSLNDGPCMHGIGGGKPTFMGFSVTSFIPSVIVMLWK